MSKRTRIFLFLFLSVTFSFAQENFQGTIVYDFKIIGEGVEAYQSMLPTGLEINVLKSDMITQIQGGMMAEMMGRTITQTKKNMSYMIRDNEKTIYVIDPAKMKKDVAVEKDPEITKEDEIITISGYQCQKYKAVSETEQGESTSFLWITDKFQLPKSESSVNGGLGTGMLTVKGVKGTPLKIMVVQGPMTIVLTVSKISKTPPAKSLFKLPKGYEKKDFDAEKMGGGL